MFAMKIEQELIRASEKVEQARADLDATLKKARQMGMTWTDMARVLDVSPQAVQQKANYVSQRTK